MKKNFFYPCICIAILFIANPSVLIYAQQNTPPVYHALIIDISKYAASNGWRELESANDANLLMPVLKNCGFSDIKELSDKECTKEGILSAIKNLKERVNPGDVVLIHYSGHGVQLEDPRPNRNDNLVECWVPIGAAVPDNFPNPANPTDFKKIEANYLKGYEIQPLLDNLRTRLGKAGDLLVTIDACCSSGSTSRGIEKKSVNRGLESPIISTDFSYNKSLNSKNLFGDFSTGSNAQAMCDYVVIAAARAQEEDREIAVKNIGYGPLSYSLATTLATISDASRQGITYASLFESIKLAMNVYSLDQMPEIEGSGINKGIFGGNYVGVHPYFNITGNTGNGQPTINGGTVQRVTVGSMVAFYPASAIGTLQSSQKLIEGTITKANPFSATVKLNEGTKPDLKNAVAVVTDYNTGNISHVSLGVKDNPQILEALKSHFSKDSFVTFSEKPDLVLEADGNNGWCLMLNGIIFRQNIDPSSDVGLKDIADALTNYAQYRYLQSINLYNPNINAKVEIITLRNGKLDVNNLMQDTTGSLAIDTGTSVAIKVTNIGNMPVYVNIIDMSPDGTMETFLPRTKNPNSPSYYPIGRCYLKPNETKYYYDEAAMTVGPPFGNEILKVFVTKDQMNLESTVATRGAATKGGVMNTIGSIFQKSYNMRGLNDNNPASLDDGTIYSKLFEITDPAKKGITALK